MISFKTESQLYAEIEQAWRLVDQYKRSAEVLSVENAHLRERYDHAVKLLVGIYELLAPPPVTTDDGYTLFYRSPNAGEQLQLLSDRIRALQNELSENVGRNVGRTAHSDATLSTLTPTLKR